MVFLSGVLAVSSLSACSDLVPYTPGPNEVIATSHDTGVDGSALRDGQAAIVYDPDGCQGWIIDDGVEGYSGRRFDPKSGLPVCNNLYPPGTVLGDYRRQNEQTPDWVPAN
jgi:hypothetical protein